MIRVILRSSVSLSNRMTQTYTLNVKDEVNNKTYKLKFPGTRTVLEVKSDVYSLIDVPVRNQQWKGWPSSLKDDNVVLAQSGICYPEHDLSVGKLPAKEEKKVVRLACICISLSLSLCNTSFVCVTFVRYCRRS